jgi:hypothetical protein
MGWTGQMSNDVFELKILFGKCLGMGYIQLRIDGDSMVVASDESFAVDSESRVEVRAIPSYENSFICWSRDIGVTHSTEKLVLGRVSDDTALSVLFENISELGEDLLDQEEEVIFNEEPQYGILSIKSTEGGSYMLITEENSLMSANEEYVEHAVRAGTSVELLGAPNDGYSFTRIVGAADWMTGGHGRMLEGEYQITVEFEKNIEPEIIEEDDVGEVVKPTEEIVSFEENDVSQNLSFGGIVLPPTKSSYVLDPTSEVKTITLEYNFDYRDGKYLMNGESFHDLVLIRGVQYKFVTTHDRVSIEILGENYQSLDLSAEGGSVTTTGEDLIFTPNGDTPEELIYRTTYRTNDVIGKIHVRSEVYYGRVTAYGYVSGCGVDDVTSGPLGEFLIGDDGSEFINPSSTATGTDIHAQIPNLLTYKTLMGSTQLNVLTTLFAKVGFGRLTSTYEVNQKMNEMLGIEFPCDILNDDPIRKILLGDVRYIPVYKKLLILNALLNFIKRVNPSKLEDVYGRLAWSVKRNQPILLGESAYLTDPHGPLKGFVNETALPTIASVLSNLFGWVELSEGLADWAANKHKLFAFGKAFQLDFLEKLATLNETPTSNEALNAWSNWGTIINNRLNELNPVALPSHMVMDVGSECDMLALGLLSPMMKKAWTDVFFANATNDQTTPSADNLYKIYGKVISVEYTAPAACYSISTLPAEFVPTLPEFVGGVTSYMNESVDECCSNLPDNIFEEDDTDYAPVDIFSFKLIESGDSKVMYQVNVNTESHPIEYLGNDEYRLYLDDELDIGNISEASPGYCAIPSAYATKMEQRYLKVGYNSDEKVREVFAVTTAILQLNVTTDMTTPNILLCTTLNNGVPVLHGLTQGDSVEFTNSPSGKIDGTHLVLAELSQGFGFSVYNSEWSNVESYKNLTADIESSGLTKVECNTEGFAPGDTVIFDKSPTNGLTFNIDEVADDYIAFERTLPTDINWVVKSHVNENPDEVVEFMYTSKDQYYSVADVTLGNEKLWLTYDPDIAPEGRAGHTISYIQFFYNKLEWNG